MNRGFVFSPSVVVILVLSAAVHYACGDCWDTGCQPDSWLVKGCATYGMKEIKHTPCGGGNVYSCCHQHNSVDTSLQLNKIGDLTYYELGLTACGQVYTNEDMVAAIAFGHFTTPNPNLDPMCGKQVKIVDLSTSKSIIVTVRDKCQGCKMNDIDVSPSAFEKFKPKIVGRFKVSWDFI
ncbi:uncharacterized protein LOC100571999 isoform X1 [Acyrthosiphon pisum]|uniref:RlpA-like protein double-psi beta-barrel domain-containing protein n=1 Tax=Acyrthosiphon pisum TaxID=7029 RepID=A0A8R2B9C0_ACYPI|nr:uncharacterized protein LOC100571999 isoform X1 [Acyrthosiphon pisum]|eukprot:XP_008187959.1 PREDICTED: papain inhibitor-like [Acyrthosiphon pisum]